MGRQFIESRHTMRPEIIIHTWKGPLKSKLDSRDPLENEETALCTDQYHSNVGRT